MTQRLEAVGEKRPESQYKWDDGSDHDNVKRIYVRGDREGIQFIKFEYVGSGQLIDESFHGFSNEGFTQMFEIDHLQGEYLTSVEGFHDNGVILALQFKTNLKISEIMGYEFAYLKFTLAMNGSKIIGFHGSAKSNLNSLGAYVTRITPTKMEAKGGKGGIEWNDGYDYAALTNIHVRASSMGIENIRIDYVNSDGHQKVGLVHGSSSGGYPLQTFDIDHHDNEYLLAIDRYYNETSGGIKALQFKTNLKTSELVGGNNDDDNEGETSKKFSLVCNGNKIIGFHGYADKKLSSLGAYFTPIPITKIEFTYSAKGHLCDSGCTGNLWDDGTFQGVRKVYVYYDSYYMRCVRFEYDNGGKVESREHGSKAVVKVEEGEFVLDYPDEFLTSVKGTITSTFIEGYQKTMIASMSFKTSKGRTSSTFGNELCTSPIEFELERNGCPIIGFHGRSTYDVLHALGAYFVWMPPAHDGEKLKEQGGDGGLDGV